MAQSLVSPCVGACKIDLGTGYCLGCARTGHEIASWRSGSEAYRQSIWDVLPARFRRLGLTTHRLPWTANQIRTFVRQTIEQAKGTWVLGVVGAVGEFTRDAGEAVDIAETDASLEAVTPRAALRLRCGDEVRALAVGAGEPGESAKRIVLAVPKTTLRLPVAAALAALGPDADFVRCDAREARLYDFGLGRAAARFCIRTGDEDLIAMLDASRGQSWSHVLDELGPHLIERSPTRVIETALGRVEIDTQIPPPGGASPCGPHTHFLPDYLALNRDMPVGMEISEVYAPGAIFYST